jgi:hypothetical protein
VIVVISCGAKKASTAQPIEDLYVGPYFKAMRAWAESVTTRCFVLSALYGLVPFGERHEPYEQRMDQPGATTTGDLVAQAKTLGIDGEHDVVVVGGKPYVKAARAVWPNAKAPFARYPGIGYQLQAMKVNRGRVPA